MMKVGAWNHVWTVVIVVAVVGLTSGIIYWVKNKKDDEDSAVDQKDLYVSTDINFMDYFEASDTDDFSVESIYMRSENNFLQGLYFDQTERLFYESAGLYGESHFQKLIPQDDSIQGLLVRPDAQLSEADARRLGAASITLIGDLTNRLPASMFGEGLSPRSASEFAILTWRERVIYIVDRSTLEFRGEYSLPDEIAEGWGITADESKPNANGFFPLYVSDGSDTIFLVDGESMTVTESITVVDPTTGDTVKRLNELEFANGYIYANIWYKDIILKIDPATGTIVKQWDIHSLEVAEKAFQNDQKGSWGGDVLNGIAYDSANDLFFFSGKRYHLIFKVDLNQ